MGAWLVAALAACACAAAPAAEPRRLAASVVSAREGLAYVAAADSGVLASGMTLTLVRGKRTIATAVVARLLDARLAEARITSGSLARERRLARLAVLGAAEPPARVTALRVGLPGAARTNLLFACGASELNPRLGDERYAADTLAGPNGATSGGAARRLLRTSVTATGTSAPDTLLVRWYGDSSDEEIALERHEIDVAVFWPGEVSARMRSDTRWRDPELGLRSRGVVACVATGGDTLPGPPADLATLNREAFAGDLLAWDALEPGSSWSPARYAADPSLPGARLIGRVLARAASGGRPAEPGPARTVRLAYLDVPVAGRDAVQASWRTRGVTPVFAVRCAVLAAGDARAVVRALGAGAFADLVSCASEAPGEPRP